MPSPYFSIIIPFYNKEKSLDLCLKSLFSQDYPKDQYEIICVNNNSTDGSLGIVEKYPRVKLTHEKKQGAYVSRNSGYLNSKGDYLIFTDADVEAPPDWLANISHSVGKHNYDLVIGWYEPNRPVKLLQIHGELVAERIKKAIKQNQPSMLTACAANLVIKRSIFEKEGRFRLDSNSEDMYFAIRCLKNGCRVGFEEDIAVKRNDMDSSVIFILKNFIYGCSNTRDTKDKVHISGKIRYMLITVKFIFKNFPDGLGLLPFILSYFSGYFLSKTGILNERGIAILVNKYTRFIEKKAI